MNISNIAYQLTAHETLTFINMLIPGSAVHAVEEGFQVRCHTPYSEDPVGNVYTDPSEAIYATAAELSQNEGVEGSLIKFIAEVSSVNSLPVI